MCRIRSASCGDAPGRIQIVQLGGGDRRIEAQHGLSNRQPLERLIKIVTLALVLNGGVTQ